MNKHLLLFPLILLSALLLTQCSSSLKSESGLYDVTLKHSYKDPVDGTWLWDGAHPYANTKNVRLYLAPLDVSLIAQKHPKLAPLLVEQFQQRVFEQFSYFLKKHNKHDSLNWQLTTDPRGAQMRINFALVKFTPQYPALRTLVTAASLFSPVPGVGTVAAYFTEGSIAVEATIRDTKTQQLYLAFKDSNRKTAYLYTKEAYMSTGQANTNFKHWASKMATLMSRCQSDGLCYTHYKDDIKKKSWLRALWDQAPIPGL